MCQENQAVEVYRGVTLKDQVERLYDILEKVVDHQIASNNREGVDIKLRPQKYLEGWDFRSVATDQDPLYPQIAYFPTMGEGWVDLCKAIHAITFFGRGFGEIIEPVNKDSCSRWSMLPSDQFYLAASVSHLQKLASIRGEEVESPMRLRDDLFWAISEEALQNCFCTTTGRCCDRAQKIHRSSRSGKTNSVRLDARSAVIFKQGSRWLNASPRPVYSRQETSPSASDQGDAAFHDSGIGRSVQSEGEEIAEASLEPGSSSSNRPVGSAERSTQSSELRPVISVPYETSNAFKGTTTRESIALQSMGTSDSRDRHMGHSTLRESVETTGQNLQVLDRSPSMFRTKTKRRSLGQVIRQHWRSKVMQKFNKPKSSEGR